MEPPRCWMILVKNSVGFLQLLTFCSKCEELGVQAPVGYWDPAGLAKDGDVETFKRRCLPAERMDAQRKSNSKGLFRGWYVYNRLYKSALVV